MADSTFWRDLADKFRALDPDGLLCADWKCEKGLPYEWSIRAKHVVGGGRDTRLQFEALARYAGAEVENPHSRSLLDAWLDALNKETENDTFGSGPPEGPDRKPTSTWGSIHRISQASATFCCLLQSRALEAEAAPTTPSAVETDALSELRTLGLTIDIDENAAARIWGGLQIIDGRYFQRHYHKDKNSPVPTTRQHLFDAYHTIAENIVNADTPTEVLENMIPSMISAFRLKEDWWPRTDLETLKRMLQGPRNEWKGKRLLMRTELSDDPPVLRKPEEIPQQSQTPDLGAAVKEVQHIETDPIAEERAALLIAFKAKARKQGIKVTDAMVAKAAKSTWNTRTMVAWWKRNDPNCKPTHDRLIRAVLARVPASIWPRT